MLGRNYDPEKHNSPLRMSGWVPLLACPAVQNTGGQATRGTRQFNCGVCISRRLSTRYSGGLSIAKDCYD